METVLGVRVGVAGWRASDGVARLVVLVTMGWVWRPIGGQRVAAYGLLWVIWAATVVEFGTSHRVCEIRAHLSRGPCLTSAWDGGNCQVICNSVRHNLTAGAQVCTISPGRLTNRQIHNSSSDNRSLWWIANFCRCKVREKNMYNMLWVSWTTWSQAHQSNQHCSHMSDYQ